MVELNKNDYDQALALVNTIEFNTFFAKSVIKNPNTGKIYADKVDDPKTFYIVHQYSMSLLCGFPYNEEFNASFKVHALNQNQKRNTFEWMQVFPKSWNHVLHDLFYENTTESGTNTLKRQKGIIELNTRLNFTLNLDKYCSQKISRLPPEMQIVRTNHQYYNEMQGTVLPSFFWESAEAFVQGGVGYSLLYEGALAATAFSAFILDKHLEIGIETIPEFRRKGCAELVCAALIDHCLSQNLIPVWACRLENTGSVKLATKLGFEISGRLPYYRLSN